MEKITPRNGSNAFQEVIKNIHKHCTGMTARSCLCFFYYICMIESDFLSYEEDIVSKRIRGLVPDLVFIP